MFWENSTHGINPHNVGMFDCGIENEEDLMAYIESTGIYCVEREEKYINFPPVNIMEYFERQYVEGKYYGNGAYKKIRVIPQIEDLQYLRTFKFEDMTFRGTEETMPDPLYERLAQRKNPAKKMLDMRKQGIIIQEIILEYGRI